MLPLAGIGLFFLLYLLAASLYPGGSQANRTARGFNWLHNYWCNLLNQKAINGQLNTARPVAIAGMLVLCFSMAVFWWLFAQINFKNTGRKVMQASGIVSAITGIFLFTSYHDWIINLSGILAIFAFAGTFIGLYKNGWMNMFWFGMVNIALIGFNNFIYYSTGLLYMLPVVQKITFGSFLLWIGIINFKLYQLVKAKTSTPLTWPDIIVPK